MSVLEKVTAESEDRVRAMKSALAGYPDVEILSGEIRVLRNLLALEIKHHGKTRRLLDAVIGEDRGK